MNKFLQIILLICPLALFAQPGKNNDVVVTGGYTPKLVEAQKINEQPSISDTTVSRFPIKYELNSRRVTTVYEVDPKETDLPLASFPDNEMATVLVPAPGLTANPFLPL